MLTVIKMVSGAEFRSNLDVETVRTSINGANNGGRAMIPAYGGTNFGDPVLINLNLVESIKAL